MRPVDSHLYALLLDHDCVIVPAFGGFVASREAARIDGSKQLAIPPRRKIAFNVYLKQNDGLLANRMVETELVSYPQALESIDTFVAECLKTLDSGQKVSLKHIGELALDAERNIQFEPDQRNLLLPEAFGLTSIPVLPVVAEENTKGRKNRPSLPLRRHSSKQRKWVGALFIAGSLLWLCFNVYLVTKERYQKASLNPLDSVLPTPEITPPVTPTMETLSVTPEPVVAETSTTTLPQVITPPDTTAVAVTPTLPPLPLHTDSYFIVAGVFRQRENADRLLEQLKNSGYPDAALMEADGPRYYVTYGEFASRNEAVASVRSIKESSREGWIYHRR